VHEEAEAGVSLVTTATLGLLAFILSFTFAIVSNRYDSRKTLVREEANAIRTAFARSAFLPETDREKAEALLERYVGLRLDVVRLRDFDGIGTVAEDALRTQRQLWQMAVVNARRDMNSDVAALYIEALNEVANVHALRVALGVQERLPTVIWLVLLTLLLLAMTGVGYQSAVAGSGRTWAVTILALSFALVVALIAALDRPDTGYFVAAQRPLEDVRAWMEAERAGR
jgi:hypothetical protein